MGNIQREELPINFRLRRRKACRPVQRISRVQPRIPHRKKFLVIMGVVLPGERRNIRLKERGACAMICGYMKFIWK